MIELAQQREIRLNRLDRPWQLIRLTSGLRVGAASGSEASGFRPGNLIESKNRCFQWFKPATFHSNATPTLFWLNQTTRHLRTTRSFSVIRLNRAGRNAGFGTSIAAPSAERFSTRHLVLDPSPQI